MSKYIELNNPKIIHMGRDKYGNGIYHIPPDLQTADVVEVVRCKECKFYDPTHPYGTVIPDVFHCKINDRFYETSHFCGYGERRENEN